MLFPLLVAVVVSAEPAPTATPLRTIVRLRTSPICTTIRQNVVHLLDGLQTNDGIVNASKPVLLRMGTEFQPVGVHGELADTQQTALEGISSVPGGVHETNPALILDNQRLKQLANELRNNLAIIDGTLADPAKFPSQTTSDDEQALQLLKAQLQAIADQQRRNFGVLAGLADTFSMQDLIAKGDGLQGVANAPNGSDCAVNSSFPCGAISHNDQDVSFKDPITASSQENERTPKDPTVDKDPAISQRGTDLSNNPMARFYLGVTAIQQRTGKAEDTLGQTLTALAASCGP